MCVIDPREQIFATEPHTKTSFVREVEGGVLHCRVAPSCWMTGQPSLVRFVFSLGEDTANIWCVFYDHLDLVYQRATDDDLERIIDGWIVAGGVVYLQDVIEKRKANKEHFDSGLSDVRKRAMEEYYRVKQEYITQGYKFMIKAWVHPAIGSDFGVHWAVHDSAETTHSIIEGILKQQGCTQMNDFQVIVL